MRSRKYCGGLGQKFEIYTHTVNRFQSKSTAVLVHALCKILKVGFIFLIPSNLSRASQSRATVRIWPLGLKMPGSGLEQCSCQIKLSNIAEERRMSRSEP